MFEIYDDDFVEFLDHVDLETELFENYPRAAINRVDLFNESEKDFIRKYRFSKAVFTNQIVPMVYPEARTPPTNRGLPLPSALKVAAALRFYATGTYQSVCADLTSMSQASVSRSVAEVSAKLAHQLRDYVHFPQGNELNYSKRRFYEMYRFPNVIGCLDCTHIPIISPGPNAEQFRCRKGYYSLNVQLATGPNLEIMDCVTRWPGSTHDSRVFQNSSLRWRLENPRGDLQRCFLLGDSGYGQTKYLYTPVKFPTTRAELRYNRAHKSTRNSVERAIGVLKRRFPCLLYELRNKLATTTDIIAACCVLHNVGRMHDPRDFNEEHIMHNWDRFVIEQDHAREDERGRLIKSLFIQRHFNRVV